MQQECDIDVKLVEIWGNCAVWWSAPSQPTTCPVSQCPTQVTVADICFTYIHEQFELRADAHFF